MDSPSKTSSNAPEQSMRAYHLAVLRKLQTRHGNKQTKRPRGAFLFVPADTTSKKRLALFDRLVFASLHTRLVCGADNALAAYQFL